jgi:hypothetical protein
MAALIDAAGTKYIARGDVIEHRALPEFSLPLARCFEKVPPGGRRP